MTLQCQTFDFEISFMKTDLQFLFKFFCHVIIVFTGGAPLRHFQLAFVDVLHLGSRIRRQRFNEVKLFEQIFFFFCWILLHSDPRRSGTTYLTELAFNFTYSWASSGLSSAIVKLSSATMSVAASSSTASRGRRILSGCILRCVVLSNFHGRARCDLRGSLLSLEFNLKRGN